MSLWDGVAINMSLLMELYDEERVVKCPG